MKNGMDSTAVGRAPEPDFANRKLIRPSLNRERATAAPSPDRQRTPLTGATMTAAAAKKVAPPEQTHAENFYYQKQMQAKTPMIIVTHDGEELRGVIEWYDKACIKINRVGQPNLMIYKACIKYMFKEGEQNGRK